MAPGPLNKSDQFDVEVHRPGQPAGLHPVKWPAAPAVASPDNITELVAAVFRVLADAGTTLSRMRGDRRTR